MASPDESSSATITHLAMCYHRRQAIKCGAKAKSTSIKEASVSRREEMKCISTAWLYGVATEAGYKDLNTSLSRIMSNKIILSLDASFISNSVQKAGGGFFWTGPAGGILMSIIHHRLITPFPVKRKEGPG